MALPIWVGKYIGLPFKERGRTVHGVDCWGLLRLVYKNEFGIDLPSLSTYEDTSDTDEIKAIIERTSRKWIRIEDEAADLGDALILSMAGHAIHVGIVIGDGEFLHTYNGQNAIRESYVSRRWKNRVVAVYRHRAMMDYEA